MKVFVITCFLLVLCVSYSSEKKCSEVLCASVVSKCMLTQACKCDISRDPEKCHCCADCAKCLGDSFLSCCTCLEICHENALELDPNDSQVGDIKASFVELFEAVVNEPTVEKLNVYKYLVEWHLDELENKLNRSPVPIDVLELGNNRVKVNCTVAFNGHCLSAAKCREECDKIGSGAYRYFFNGCCECIGPTCHSYGINESRCPPECSNLDDYMQKDQPVVNNKVEDDL